MGIAYRKSFVAFTTALMILAACCGGGSSTSGNSPPVQAPESTASAVDRAVAAGALPALNSAQGAGPDTDGNGVRDDIDAFIQRTWGTDASKAKAATQTASAIQSAIGSGLSINAATAATAPASAPTAAQLDAVSQSLDDAVVCLAVRFNGGGAGNALTQLENATTNTKERYLAYRTYNSARSGTSRAAANTDATLKCK